MMRLHEFNFINKVLITLVLLRDQSDLLNNSKIVQKIVLLLTSRGYTASRNGKWTRFRETQFCT